MENDYTVLQEMQRLGVAPKYFESFYDELKETKIVPTEEDVNEGLPPGSVPISQKQYKTIVDYFRARRVLGHDHKIIEKGLKSLDDRIDCERRERAAKIIREFKERNDRRISWYMKDGRFRLR